MVIKVNAARWENAILQSMVTNWTPSSGFDDNGRMAFDIVNDLDRIPTRKYPFTHLEDALYPLFVYLGILLIGQFVFALNGKNTKGKPLINKRLLYNLKFIYNIIQIFLCSYMFIESLIVANRNGYYLFPLTHSRCNKFNFSEPVFDKLLWLFYVSKIFDFFDTIFIILGNKHKQFTFLHQYHHITIYLVYWLNVNLSYDADIYLTITLNAFIHTIMYIYYLISMHLPKDIDKRTGRSKYGIWWKKYLTMIQMVQFASMNSQAILILLNGCSECPPRVVMLYLGYILSLFAMFMKFFIKSYQKKIVGTKKKHK